MTPDDAPPEQNESTAGTTVRVRHEWSETERPSTAVIEAIAATTGRDPTSMSPLYDYLDPGALDILMTPQGDGVSNATVVTFTYDGVTVRVNSNGWIDVQPEGTVHG